MSKTTAIVSSVGLLQVQHSIVPERMIETAEGPMKVQDAYVDYAVVTLKVVMVFPGEFDADDREPFLKAIMDKLAEVEL